MKKLIFLKKVLYLFVEGVSMDMLLYLKIKKPFLDVTDTYGHPGKIVI